MVSTCTKDVTAVVTCRVGYQTALRLTRNHALWLRDGVDTLPKKDAGEQLGMRWRHRAAPAPSSSFVARLDAKRAAIERLVSEDRLEELSDDEEYAGGNWRKLGGLGRRSRHLRF